MKGYKEHMDDNQKFIDALEKLLLFMKTDGDHTTGLCQGLFDMQYYNYLITYEQRKMTCMYIKRNMPQDYSHYGKVGVYGWPKSDIKSRITWIKEQLKSLKS